MIPSYYIYPEAAPPRDAFDVAHAYGLDAERTLALKYLVRAGKKGSEIEDLTKALRCIERAIEYALGAK